jgi:hypothetical protein
MFAIVRPISGWRAPRLAPHGQFGLRPDREALATDISVGDELAAGLHS